MEFKKPNANPNVRDSDSEMFGNYGTPLIHKLIEQLPDCDLSPILTILIEYNVDIESEDLVIKLRPLAMAIWHKKYIAAEFLIEKHAKLNDQINYPVLIFSFLHHGSLLEWKKRKSHRGEEKIDDSSAFSKVKPKT